MREKKDFEKDGKKILFLPTQGYRSFQTRTNYSGMGYSQFLSVVAIAWVVKAFLRLL